MKAETYAAVMAEFVVLSSADPAARASRLVELREENADRADTLERLLIAHDLEQSPLEERPPALSTLPPPTRLPVPLGESLGAYRLESVLGEGGMGCVYLGVHEVLGRRAAVKVLKTELAASEEFATRFLHEAKIVNEIHHANVVDVYDFITTTEPPRVAFVMELLDAPSLQEVLREHGPLSVAQARNVGLQLCDALSAVHARGVVHRDLKPDNLVVVAHLDSDLDAVPSIKVLDFGIAKVARPDAAVRTSTGAVMGTPAYMSPEQLAADPISPATDVYAVGEILFEMVIGRRLFPKQGIELMSNKLLDRPPDVAEVEHEGLAELIWGCVRPGQADRLKLEALIAGLEALAPEPRSLPTLVAPRRWVGALGIAVAGAMGAAVWALADGESKASLSPTPSEPSAQVSAPRVPRLEAPQPEVFPPKAADDAAAPVVVAPSPAVATGPPARRAPARGREAKRAQAPARAVRPRTKHAVPLRSEPTGATVQDLATGRVMGTTPLQLQLASGAELRLSVSLEGYERFELSVSSERPPETLRLRSTAVPTPIPIGETKTW